MSTTDRTPSVPSLGTDDAESAAPLARAAHRTAAYTAETLDRTARAAEAAAFWLAALLPLAYLPTLATGAAAEHPLAFVGVLVVHAAALVLGRGHAADAGSR
ncbi:hypothetical protein [Halobaculum sp. EA56]|uniref:hypothetical protein n=1 Tax=Halobaculum sp. EA56 TaxID=3421648 RepID=UPI003EB69870